MNKTPLLNNIRQFIPAWILEEYAAPYGEASLEQFFRRWLEHQSESKNPIQLIESLRDSSDLDKTDIDYLHKYHAEDLAAGFNTLNLVDARTVLKHIREFYAMRGTVDSIKLYFKLFHGVDVDLMKPSDYILRASDGKWVQPYYLKINSFESDYYESLETLKTMVDSNYLSYLKSSDGSIFSVDGLVELGGEIQLELHSGDYKKLTAGETVTFGLIINNVVYEAAAAKISSLSRGTGRFINNDGKLNSDRYLQDSYYYQDYSYVLRIPDTLDESEYKDAFMKLMHPAGFKVFFESVEA